ncbi:MAG: hypothetical protein ACE141_16370 [Bryobacteraceae bacterium]
MNRGSIAEITPQTRMLACEAAAQVCGCRNHSASRRQGTGRGGDWRPQQRDDEERGGSGGGYAEPVGWLIRDGKIRAE